jgi:cytochrome c2
MHKFLMIFLLSKAGGSVPKENINLLIDEKASSGQVVTALSEIENKCKKNDLVYFYFSGHGDISGIHNNSYLLCANTPSNEYINMALSVRDLNDIANTISAKKGGQYHNHNRCLPCRKITGNENRGPLLNGLLGKATEEKEIRLVACAADERSAENIDWGEGKRCFFILSDKGFTRIGG